MKKLCLIMCLGFLATLVLHAQSVTEGIPVFQGNIELDKDGRSFSYAFAQGDKVLLKVVTGKRKELRNIRITTLSGDVVWSKENTPSFEEEISLSREGVYTLSVEKKGLFNQTIGLDIFRKPGAVADYNPAWTKHNRYKAEVVSFKVDTAVGYESAVQNEIDLKVFNKYLFQNISLYNFKDQVKGNLALDGNHVQGFPMGIDPNKVPKGAKFKCYTYSLNSVLGGQKHWAIAELAGQIGGTAASIFLTPAAGFAVHGAMALVGPAPNKAPVMYYMSNRHSDIKTIGEMKSNTGKAKGAVNTYTNAVSSVIGLVNKDAGKAVKNATELDTKTEADLDYTQKGNITNLFVNSAIPPTEKYFIMTNSYLMHAKNIHLSATAMYYVPSFLTVKAKEEVFNLKKEQIEKTETKFSKTTE